MEMGEPKRVTFTTISTTTTVASLGSTSNDPAGGLGARFSGGGDGFLAPEAPAQAAGKLNASKVPAKTIRLELKLFETDSNKYPEFNYSKLMQKKVKKLKQKVSNGPPGGLGDPFADNDDDVARIAKELEQKYGNAYGGARGRSKKDDFCDIGMGYDESDPFIDNTEAYDEVIPEDVETKVGGFYINCGALEFKNLTKKSGTTRTDEIIKMPDRPRKRVLSTSSEESSSSDKDDDDNDEDDENDNDSEDDEDEEDSESESLDDEEDIITKKKFKHSEKRSKTELALKQKENNGNKKTSKKLAVTTSSSSNSPRPNAMEQSDTDERQLQAQAQAQALKKVVKTTTIKDMLKAKRDSFLKSQADSAVKVQVINGEVKSTSTDVESSSENGGTDSATEQGARSEKGNKNKETVENLRSADTILPASLDMEILSSVNIFKEMVRSRDMCGKKFYFDDKLTALLLKVYEALLCTDRNERNMVFAHLEYQLQLPKYFILRKSKALRSKEEKNKTTVALEKLRKAIVETMPRAIANYEMELRKFAEQTAADVDHDHPPKMPRKKFQWNNDLRSLLYEVYQARWTSYVVLGKRKDTLEEFITSYLKEKVVDLWPTGWMRSEELQREIEKYKSASQKSKEKEKSKKAVSLTPAAPMAVPTTEALTAAAAATSTGYFKQFEEFATAPPLQGDRQSRGNSDTDSVTSASSSSLKRPLKEQPAGAVPPKKQTVKPPKKKVQKQQSLPVPQIEPILGLPSTSAQAAALQAAATAGLILDLASPTKRTDHSIYSIMTASLAEATATTATATTLHSKLSNARVMPHVINLDDYHCPSDILHTSQQLAAAGHTGTVRSDGSKWASAQATPVIKKQRKSSSESDGVEIVDVTYPTKVQNPPVAKAKTNHRNKTVVNGPASSGTVHGPNGSLPFDLESVYMFNNNNMKTGGNAAVAAAAAAAALRGGVAPHGFDLTNPELLKTYSDMKALEKIKWAPSFSVSPGTMKGNGGPTHQ